MKIHTLLLCLTLAAGAACGGDDGNSGGKDGGIDAPRHTDSGVDGPILVAPDASCFDLSTITAPTNNEIINACTTSDKIYKDSHPPLTLPDGGLAPLGSD
jgi:hypothetical protein